MTAALSEEVAEAPRNVERRVTLNTKVGVQQLTVLIGGCGGGTSIQRLVTTGTLWSQMTSAGQDGDARIPGDLASFLYRGKKWRRVVHLYTHSMVPT